MNQRTLDDFEWYRANLLNLFMKFGPCKAIIRNKEVVGVFDTSREAREMAERCFEPGTYIIQTIGADEGAYHIGWMPC